MKKDTEAREAKHGQKMIEVRLRFWTDSIAKESGKILPKHAWSAGVVRIAPNKSHSIVPGNPKPFDSILDVGAVIEKVLIEQGIVLHLSQRTQKYMTGE